MCPKPRTNRTELITALPVPRSFVRKFIVCSARWWTDNVPLHCNQRFPPHYVGSLHNSSLATQQFVKISVYHAEWTKYITMDVTGFDSVDHCAFWCRILPIHYNHPCHMFHISLPDKRCYMGTREHTRLTTLSNTIVLCTLRNQFLISPQHVCSRKCSCDRIPACKWTPPEPRVTTPKAREAPAHKKSTLTRIHPTSPTLMTSSAVRAPGAGQSTRGSCTRRLNYPRWTATSGSRHADIW